MGVSQFFRIKDVHKTKRKLERGLQGRLYSSKTTCSAAVIAANVHKYLLISEAFKLIENTVS